MAKIAKLLLLLFLTCSTLFGAINYFEELKSYDKKIETSSKDELLRVFHSLKNIYIHSIVTNDEKLKIETLKRLVTSSNELNLESTHYQKELDTLTNSSTQTKKQDKPVLKKVEEKKPEIPKEEPVQKIVQESLLHYNAQLILKDINFEDGVMELEFDKDIKSSDVKYFQLKSLKSFREVYDIKGILTKNYQVEIPENLSDLRIAQYDKETIRIVLQKEKVQKSTKTLHDTKLKIFFNANQTQNQSSLIKPQKYDKFFASKKVIVLDAGHGGKDGGAVGYKNKVEKKAVLSITLEIGKELKKRGYQVYYTRNKDKFIQLRDRTKLANDKDADIFISIHANAAPNKSQYLSHKGLETYFLSPARSDRSKNIAALENQSDIEEMNFFSKQTFLNVFNREKIISANKLALDIQQGMISQLRTSYKITDGGVREAPFWVLVGAQMPSILIEVGYITNPTEAQRMFEGKYQKLLAKGVADGLDGYFVKNN